jgi:iron complex outermembrane recepter protein
MILRIILITYRDKSMSRTPVSKFPRLHLLQAMFALAVAAPAPGVFAQTTGSGTADNATVHYSIAAQSLARALTDWSAQSRMPLSVPPALVAAKTAPAVSGNLAPMNALERLLVGSGLVAFAEGSTVVIRRAQAPESTLAPIKVTAAARKESPLGYLDKDAATGALGNKPVLDTPFSVTVVDSNEMLERGAKSVGQIFFNDASVYTPTPSSSTDWWGTQIRGLGVRNSYIDDIPVLLYWGGDFPTEVVESVTALKGLSGFMYGFGEPGGALSYKLKRPTATPETSVTAGYRNPRLFSAHVDTSQVFGGDLGVRANLATEQGTAYNAGEINRVVASLAVDKRFSASLKWQSTFVYEDSKTTAEPLQFYFDAYDVAGSNGQLPKVTYKYGDINVDNSYYKTRTLLASTGLEWRIDDAWNLKYQVGFSRKDHQSNKAFANLLNQAGDYGGAMYNFAGQLDTLFTQAILQGTVSWGGMKHELVGGIGLQRSRDKWASDFYWSPDFSGNIHVTQPFLVTRTPDFSLLPVSADTAQTYAFFSDTIHVNEHWQVIAGLRYTNLNTKDLDNDPAVDSGYKIHKATPTLAVIYKPDAQTSVYASYVEGLEPGTRVSALYANAGELLGATVSRQAEIGVKHQSGSVEYTAALFRIARANQMDVLKGTDRYLTQDGLVVYRGAELSAAYQSTNDLNLGLSAIYLDAFIDRVSADNAAFQGNTPANASRWQAVANVQYRVPSFAGLKLQAGLRYFGPTYTSDDNQLSVPGRTVANAGLSYDFKWQGQELSLFGNVNNLFNRKYWASGGWSAGNVGEARNVSLALRAQF